MTEPFKLAFRADQRRFTDRQKFEVYVLWLVGYSASSIAAVVGIDRKRVLNMINRSEYAGRSQMPDAQRKGFLKELWDIRFDDGVSIDGGRLDRLEWKILPFTDGRKIRPGKVRVS